MTDLEKVVSRLATSPGYFHWKHLGSGLLLRTGKTDLPEATWLKNERPKLVHICRPKQLVEAIEAGKKDRTVAHSSYVLDGTCGKCGTEFEIPAEFTEAVEADDAARTEVTV